MKIEVRDLEFSYGDINIFKDINLDINQSELTCILGPNGVGKSTFMFCINKLLKPTGGKVLLDGKDVAETSFKELSKIMSFVPHSEDATFSLSVMDTVLMGRQPHAGAVLTKKDLKIAAENIKLLGITELSNRGFNELSAGQHQRAMIARGRTQETQILLLDEPTANLDVRYQMLVMRMLRDIARVKKISVIVICHDLNVTSLYADRIILLSKGGVYADGTSEEVLTADNIREVYGVESEIIEKQGRPHIILKDSDSLDSHIEEIANDMLGNEYDLLEEEKKEAAQ
ncbi:MAG: ABC transporter ATP-binding protein [archaeon]|nr:ABC transporter ATP-binding protein [archaeon]